MLIQHLNNTSKIINLPGEPQHVPWYASNQACIPSCSCSVTKNIISFAQYICSDRNHNIIVSLKIVITNYYKKFTNGERTEQSET